MAEYSITFSRAARKELESLPAMIVERIFKKIEALAALPRPQGVIQLEGEENLYRIRVGDYRVIYTISDKSKTIDIIHIRHRSEAYRSLN
ncbi:MAG: type II toxin-antitoxin system RelE/ParE family toxin [Candidatus Kapaibacterium sp.]